MNKKQLAQVLNGRVYGKITTAEESRQARKSGLVVVYGHSDDGVVLTGAIDAEISAYGGKMIRLSRPGRILKKKEVEVLINHDVPIRTITAHWAPPDPPASWLITADFPAEPFDIYEDGELFCRGIVFHMDDLKYGNEG